MWTKLCFTGLLTLVSVRSEHSGIYSCIARNVYGSARSDTELRVEGELTAALLPVLVRVEGELAAASPPALVRLERWFRVSWQQHYC